MIAVKTLLSPLARPEVSEIVLRSNSAPEARVGSAGEAVDDDVLSNDDVLALLYAAGGSRYTESLGAKATNWRTRVEGVGAVNVSATMTADVIEAHFTLRDAAPGARPQTVPPAKPPKSVRTPPVVEADGALQSRRKSRSGIAPPPRAPDSGDRPSSVPPPAQRVPRVHDADASPLGRAQMKTLAGSDIEIDLDITAGDIPSVPHPPIFHDDGAFSPTSPRTMPEARFTRDTIEPPPARRSATPTPSVTVSHDIHDAPTPTAFATGVAPREIVAELNEPFAPSMRRPLVATTTAPVASPRPARTTTGRTTRPFAREPHTAMFRKLLRSARDAGASDLHIAADRPPSLRVFGQLAAKGDVLEARVVEDMIVSRVPSRLAAALDHDGACVFAHEEAELGRFRVSVSRHRAGIKASLRLVALELPTLASLGLPDVIALSTRHRSGLVVLAGPSGHGRTTTLAAFVDLINRETTRHVVTIEDPIELVHPRKKSLMSQREVGAHTRDVASGLRAAAREDPDVIVVGELRSAEAVRLAVAASEAGHLIVATMSTGTAARTIERLIELFPLGDQPHARAVLAGGLKLVVSQRLVPLADGRGMVAAAEVLPGMVPLWTLIRENRVYQLPALQQRGKGIGLIRLDDSLAELVRAGRVAAPAALAVAEAPDDLAATLGLKPGARAPASPVRSDAKPLDAGLPKGGFLERAGAIFGGGKKGS